MRHAPPAHRSRSPILRWGVPAVATLIAVSMAAPAAQASKNSPSSVTPVVVASGLDNPRQLSLARNGDIYVAEAGRGALGGDGSGPCLPNPEDPADQVCFGTSGAVTRISQGTQKRVVTGLPSIAGADGSQAIGPSDVFADRGKLRVLIGLGADPAVRTTFPQLAKMGTLVKIRHGKAVVIADVAAFEAKTNPIHEADSNPVGLLRTGRSYVIADAGGNTVVRAGKRGSMSTLAVLKDQDATAPPFLGLPPGTKIPAQAVPTSVAVGPDGAYYVSQLTGFPFEKGLAKIYRIGWHGKLKVYASGLTNVTDLAFAKDGTLYAVQISSEGLLNGPVGSLVKVKPGKAPQVVADNLFAPYGLAISGKWAYVTTGSVAAGGGEVVKIQLSQYGYSSHRR